MRSSLLPPICSVPPQAETAPVPVLYWLSGLTCTHENFVTKAGATRAAAARGLMLVMPYTSPPEQGWEDAWYAEKGLEKSWDFGYKASMYVNATEAPWSTGGYRMHDYVTVELPALIESNFAATSAKAISGHSMGGHGALICALRNPGAYASASAFAPICNPIKAAWGLKAFTHYLGADQAAWKEWDACELAAAYAADAPALPLLVDQGAADGFLTDGQLLPENLSAAVAGRANLPLVSRMQEGYDHSYHFIASFVDDHVNHAADALEGR
jgi:S-formylglutathione hydrolase